MQGVFICGRLFTVDRETIVKRQTPDMRQERTMKETLL
jgi:hypothetical protein